MLSGFGGVVHSADAAMESSGALPYGGDLQAAIGAQDRAAYMIHHGSLF